MCFLSRTLYRFPNRSTMLKADLTTELPSSAQPASLTSIQFGRSLLVVIWPSDKLYLSLCAPFFPLLAVMVIQSLSHAALIFRTKTKSTREKNGVDCEAGKVPICGLRELNRMSSKPRVTWLFRLAAGLPGAWRKERAHGL